MFFKVIRLQVSLGIIALGAGFMQTCFESIMLLCSLAMPVSNSFLCEKVTL